MKKTINPGDTIFTILDNKIVSRKIVQINRNFTLDGEGKETVLESYYVIHDKIKTVLNLESIFLTKEDMINFVKNHLDEIEC